MSSLRQISAFKCVRVCARVDYLWSLIAYELINICHHRWSCTYNATTLTLTRGICRTFCKSA